MRLGFQEGKDPGWAAKQILNKKKQELKNLQNLKAQQEEMNIDTTEIEKGIQSIENFIEGHVEEHNLDDQSKGTIDFDPNNVQINKASMIPDNLIEQLKSLFGGEPEAPTGIMKAGGYPRQTMTNWSELDDAEAQNIEALRRMELARLSQPEDEGSNWLKHMLSFVPLVGKNTRSGAALRMFGNKLMPEDGIRSLFNRPTTAQQQATQRFMQNYNVQRNPITGRMTTGPFAGKNLPGTSMFGSKTPQEMAQKWMQKHGSRQYNTEKMMAKQKEIRDIAAGNTNLPPGERTITPTRIHTASGQTHHPHGNGQPHGTDTSGSFAGKGSGNPFGRARGGLAGLWPR
tara:strand:+ start:1 stop:1029 length:1029 start_codon:yes stop_codon:yes gene_type:complete